jgi:hypothetical protein
MDDDGRIEEDDGNRHEAGTIQALDAYDPVVFRFVDSSAARCFELGIALEDLRSALVAPHFKQASSESFHRFEHYLQINGQSLRVVTAPDNRRGDGSQAIINIVMLDPTSARHVR